VQIRRITLGTAGHIDHGKTSLVRTLTGIDTDRLKVEKQRGITTELGFAHLDVGDLRFGFVDVPGHERFIKAMVAGAAGIDLVALTIAADEGVMPQTREHLDICALLGVRRGVVVITKADLVDGDWLKMVGDEVRAQLRSTFLADAVLIPCSVKTGQGVADVRAELVRLATAVEQRRADGVFRLPLDRVFTIKGFGTVVTGTIYSGSVLVGDRVIASPRGLEAKVRGLQIHGDDVPRAQAGVRCAVNLAGVAVDDLARGDWLLHPNALTPSHVLDARFHYLPSARGPLATRARVLLHLGTTQVLATLVLAEHKQLAPGQRALVQLRVDASSALPALPGDRFIVRGFVLQNHYGTTLGGGTVVRVHAAKLRTRSDRARELLRAMAGAEPAQRVALEVAAHGPACLPRDALHGRLGLSRHQLDSLVEHLIGDGELVQAGTGDRAIVCHSSVLGELEQQALAELARVDKYIGQQQAMRRAELRSRLPAPVPAPIFDAVLAALERRGAAICERDQVRLARPGPKRPSQAASPLAARLGERLAAAGLRPPRPAKLATELDQPLPAIRAALADLLESGRVRRLAADLYADANALGELQARLLAHLEQHGQISPAEWKALTGTSRTYSIPLAEYFDAEKITLRVGDIRKKRGGFQNR
jgi:selenocysteine-specific elongation factor